MPAAAAEDDFVGDFWEEVEVGVGDGPGGEAGEGVEEIFDFRFFVFLNGR